MNIIGVDIGGTKTAVCLGNESGDLKASSRFATNPEQSGETLERSIEEIHKILNRFALQSSEIDAIGISAPGPLSVDRQTIFQTPNLPSWRGVKAGATLKSAFGCPVFMNNDGNAAGLAEWLFGDFKSVPNLAYLTMSTGIGAGFVVNGDIIQGAADLGGEVGHICLDPEGPLCACGLRGCLEAYCGGRAVAERLRKDIVQNKISSAILDQAGGDPARIALKHLCEAVRLGDEYAVARWREYLERLAQGIGIIIMALNPAAIILGTVAIHNPKILLPPLRRLLTSRTWEGSLKSCRIEASSLNKIGELGAVAVGVKGVSEK